MKIKKINIVDGIIQDKFVGDVPIMIKIIKPKGKTNVRTLIKINECIGITNHNTGNITPTASDEMHAKWLQSVENVDKEYVSVHFFVDEDSIIQTVPIDEVTNNAGDGRGPGNFKTISIEICENGNEQKAEENAKKLNAALILTYPKLKIFKHQDWNGKYCPRRILNRENGWKRFVGDINQLVKKSKVDEIKDNSVSNWAKEAQSFVKENKISDGSRPKDNVTREEVWVMLNRMQNLGGK